MIESNPEPHILTKKWKYRKNNMAYYLMLNKSGFGWNDSLKCIEVDYDEVWNIYIQVWLLHFISLYNLKFMITHIHIWICCFNFIYFFFDFLYSHKKADGWRGKQFPLYEKLTNNIFGVDRATRKAAEIPSDMAEAVNLEDDHNGLQEESFYSPMSEPNWC